MKKIITIAFMFVVTVSAIMFVYWLGGGEFVRGESLGVTSAFALFCGALAGFFTALHGDQS